VKKKFIEFSKKKKDFPKKKNKMGCGCKKGTAWMGPTVGAPRVPSGGNLMPEQQIPKKRSAVNVTSSRAQTTVLGTRNPGPVSYDPWAALPKDKKIEQTFDEIANRLLRK
jgi:hypothetical protein